MRGERMSTDWLSEFGRKIGPALADNGRVLLPVIVKIPHAGHAVSVVIAEYGARRLGRIDDGLRCSVARYG